VWPCKWLIATAVFITFAGSSGRAQTQAVPALFGPPAAGARVPDALSQRFDTLQARPVALNAAAVMANAFDIELDSGRVVRAVIDRRDAHPTGAQSWVGHVENEPLSSVVLAWNDGVVQGSIKRLDASYSIEPTGTPGVHVMRQVDLSAARPELEPVRPANLRPAGDAGPSAAADDGSIFDVIVFYTPAAAAAAQAAGTAVSARAALGISETNSAYASSGIIPRLRLVRTQQTSYTESGDSLVDLARFQVPGDGYMDEVHAARDTSGADLAVLIVANNQDACGVGFVMTSASSSFADYAFSLTVYDCISPNYTFGHEIGHNLGSAHAPQDGSGQPSVYPYSFGYKDPGNAFRTLMAYDCPGGCPRVLCFSTPSGSHGGAPTGVPNQNDNAQSINNVRMTVANFRQAGSSSGTPPTLAPSPASATIAAGASAQATITVGDVDSAGSTLTLSASSSDPALLPAANIVATLTGTGASMRTYQVTMTPVAGRTGSAVVTFTGSDGVAQGTTTYTLTVPPSTAPSAPQNFQVSFSGRSAFMSWAPPSTGDPVSGYTLEAGSAPGRADYAAIPLGTATSFAAGGVPDGVFWLRIRASNASGVSPASNELGLSMQAAGGCVGLPLPITFAPPTVSGNHVTVTWSAPPPGPGPAVTSYVLAAGTQPGLSNLAMFDTGSTAQGLGAPAPPGVYYLRAAARNACGIGGASNEVIVAVP
jgi:hypothetical protein